MIKAEFQTPLTMEEIDKNFESFDFFSSLKSGLEEALAFEYGGASGGTVSRTRASSALSAADTRAKLNMTRKEFASTVGVSVRTIESWESGRAAPSATAQKLFTLLRDDPTLAKKLS